MTGPIDGSLGPCWLDFAEGDTLFRPEGDCAIIHAVVFSFRRLVHPVFYRKTEREDHASFQAVGGGRVARSDSDLRSGSGSHTVRS